MREERWRTLNTERRTFTIEVSPLIAGRQILSSLQSSMFNVQCSMFEFSSLIESECKNRHWATEWQPTPSASAPIPLFLCDLCGKSFPFAVLAVFRGKKSPNFAV